MFSIHRPPPHPTPCPAPEHSIFRSLKPFLFLFNISVPVTLTFTPATKISELFRLKFYICIHYICTYGRKYIVTTLESPGQTLL